MKLSLNIDVVFFSVNEDFNGLQILGLYVNIHIYVRMYMFIYVYICIYVSDISSIDHLALREFVSGPPRYHLAIEGVREQFVIVEQN